MINDLMLKNKSNIRVRIIDWSCSPGLPAVSGTLRYSRSLGMSCLNKLCPFKTKNGSANEIKKHLKGVKFHYYEITVDRRRLFLNIRVDRNKKKTTLYSITPEIKMPNPQKGIGTIQ